MSELEQLTEAWLRLGASQVQAETMAAQLLKRAGQLARQRGMSRETALAYLLKLAVQGRAGEAPSGIGPLPLEDHGEK